MPARGALPVTVPGTVEAWGRLLERFGSVGMGAVVEPAAGLAQDGYLITAQLSESLKQAAGWLGRERATHALYPAMGAGMLLGNADLASTLRDLGHSGINGVYRGEIAAAIAAAIKRRDGFVTRQDLATHRSQWVDPVAFPYRDLGVYYSLGEAHANRLEPKKLTLHTLIPAMASRGGKPWAAFGSMGGDIQPQLQAQVLMNLLVHRLDPADAVARPGKAILADGVTTAVEADYPGAGQIARSSDHVLLMPARHHSFGHAHAIVVDGPAAWPAAADPRSDGSI